MRHRNRTTTLDRKAGPRRALLRTLCVSLVTHGQIQTSLTKAKAVQRMIEPLVTKGKQPTVHAMRQIEAVLANKEAARRMIKVISPQAQNRPGGYTSIIKLEAQAGDGSEQALIRFVDNPER